MLKTIGFILLFFILLIVIHLFKKRRWMDIFIVLSLLIILWMIIVLFDLSLIIQPLFNKIEKQENKYPSFRFIECYEYLNHNITKDGKYIFALYFHQNFFGDPDPEWKVFKLKPTTNPEEQKIPIDYTSIKYKKNKIEFPKAVIWNYAESSEHTANPHLKIIDNRYVVFIRGNIYHGLYDIKKDSTIINCPSPWHKHNDENTSISLKDWKIKTLHEPIEKIIKSSIK